MTVRAVPVRGEIELDGCLTEPAWRRAPVATGFVQRRPDPGAPATAATEVRVLYSDEAIYVGARMYDDPDRVVAQLARRDEVGIYADLFLVAFDSYDDNRTAFVFAVNPAGVQTDIRISSDSRSDPSWDAVWEVQTQVDSLGWTAELRIPLSQLRYSAGATSWGVNFQREIARKGEAALWSPTPPDAPGIVSRFGTLVGLAGLASPTRVEVEPYAVTRFTRAPAPRPDDPFHSPNHFTVYGGADVQYGLTSNLTLTGTINPDFGQVEADPAVVNLTAFETFFPERRPFFVEGANIFDFGFQGGRLYYSRRIGAQPHGFVPRGAEFSEIPERTTILGAAKLSGKTRGGWSIGILDAVTPEEHAIYLTDEGAEERALVEPLTNYGVARVSKDFRGGESAIGAIFTSTNRRLADGGRLDFLRSAAYAGGIDGRHRFGAGDYEVTGSLVGSSIRGSDRAIRLVQIQPGHYFQRPDAPHLEVDPRLTSLSGLAGNIELGKIGGGHWRWQLGARGRSPSFEVDDLGFQQRTDRVEPYGRIGYVQFRPGPIFRNWNLRFFQDAEWTFGGERVGTSTILLGNARLQNYWGAYGNIRRSWGALSTSALRGGPALAMPGETRAAVGIYTDRRKQISLELFSAASFEDETDGHSFRVNPYLRLRPSPRIEISLEPSAGWSTDPAQYVDQEAAAGNTRYFFGRLEQTTASLTARLSYTFRPGLTLEFYGQPLNLLRFCALCAAESENG